MRVDSLLTWSPWYALEGAGRNAEIPRGAPGLYRLRCSSVAGLTYIGQTSNLRGRMGHLQGAFSAEMPYRDPHTAAPALWALRQDDLNAVLEVSVCRVEGSTPWRKGLEALALSLHREMHQRSPRVNFGRMPSGYRMSSANNSRLLQAGNLFRGGPSAALDDSHAAGVPPVGLLEGAPCASGWCGHRWSPWVGADTLEALEPQDTGLYRIRASGAEHLLYLGEGCVLARLRAHLKKRDVAEHPQGALFREAQPLELSWVLGPWLKHQALELENDLIAAHLLETGTIPSAQFLG